MATEKEIRAELGIPESAEKILILSQSSHLDWDWELPFPVLFDNQPPTTTTYFDNTVDNGPAATIFTEAGKMLTAGEQPTYYYSICEIGFLRAFADKYPAAFATLQQAGKKLRIVGGGITSPDNLLPTGEAFIRTYLIGKRWVDQHLHLPMNQAWLPDDFGQDSQLPVLLAAMGFQGVAFWRVPGSGPYNLTPVDHSESVAEQLTKGGADFVWQAADGSSVIAHWLQGSYCQGDPIGTDVIGTIQECLATNEPSSLTKYIFVPVGCDFRLPQDLPSFAKQWNGQSPAPDVHAVAATFDHYIQLVALQTNALKTLTTFNPVPYHTGCYAMRPLIKRHHQRTTRALVAAEIYSTMAIAATLTKTTAAARVAAIDAVWNQLAPSTHHDYITGTGFSPVYAGEQIPLVLEARDASRAVLNTVLAEVTAAVKTNASLGEIPVVVFNPLGIANRSLVKANPFTSLATLGTSSTWSVRDGDRHYSYAQSTSDGSLFFPASVDSLGYAVYYVSQKSVDAPSNPVTVGPAKNDPNALTIANGLVSFTITPSANWAITEICDLASATPTANILTGNANDLVFYDEGPANGTVGTNYRFGNETATNQMSRVSSPLLSGGTVVVHEGGPLRVRIVTTIVFTEPITNTPFPYTREYVLHWNEPFIRMRTIGAAPYAAAEIPHGYCVAVQFPLSSAIESIAHGTTAHWSDLPQVRYWSWGPAFQATHDFVIASGAGENVLGAIYHGWVNAWGQTTSDDLTAETLLGCILRNTTGAYFGGAQPLSGTDPGVHLIDYAFRVPTGLGTPWSGEPLGESLRCQVPMPVVAVPLVTSGTMPEAFSLASVTSSDSTQAIVTAAKLGSANPNAFIFRVYQPSNNTKAPPTLTLSLAGLAQLLGVSSLTVTPVTALEAALNDVSASTAATSCSFTANVALTTLAVTS